MIITDLLKSKGIIFRMKENVFQINSKKYTQEYFEKDDILKNYISLTDKQNLFEELKKEKSNLLRKSPNYQFIPLCKLCGNDTNFVSWTVGYKNYCSNECQQRVRTNSIQTRNKESISESVNKRNNTKTERYGDRNYNNREKAKETCIELYGADNPLKNSEILSKIVDTNLEKYGVSNTFLLPHSIESSRNTCFEKYGEKFPLKSEEIQNKIKNTNMKNYGVEYLFSSDIIMNKIKQTCLRKYGYEYFAQSNEACYAGYKWKEYELPDGELIKIQGYEHYLLDDLLKEFHQDDIITERRNIPEFWYFDNEGIRRRYFPDMYIPKINTIYEVKSEYTLNINPEIINLKKQCVIDAGYNFELRVY